MGRLLAGTIVGCLLLVAGGCTDRPVSEAEVPPNTVIAHPIRTARNEHDVEIWYLDNRLASGVEGNNLLRAIIECSRSDHLSDSDVKQLEESLQMGQQRRMEKLLTMRNDYLKRLDRETAVELPAILEPQTVDYYVAMVRRGKSNEVFANWQ